MSTIGRLAQRARVSRAMALLMVVACGSHSDSTGPSGAPTVTVTGVAEGTTYDVPVTILIGIDRGAYQATLDGQPFLSGSVVKTPGAHTLVVTANVSLAVSTTTVHFTIQAPAGGLVIIRMLNLGPNEDGGGGDAILITDSSAAGMTHVMIDAGPAGANASDASYVARRLTELHVDSLAILLLTHAHGDHYGGMGPVLSSIKVRRFFYNGQVRSLSSYNSVISQARLVAGDSALAIAALRDYDLGFASAPAHLRIVPPLPDNLATSTDDGTLINDGSLGAHLRVGTFTMFFTGDGEVNATRRWRVSYPDLTNHLSVLKVGHHGANNAIFDNGFSGASAWLDQVVPTVSIVSSNGTSHPRINALTRLLGQPNNRTYCTSVHGEIEIRVDRGGAFSVTVAQNADKPCVAGSGATS